MNIPTLSHPGFYTVSVLVEAGGSRKYEGVVFPQRYSRWDTNGSRLPCETKEEAELARRQISEEGPQIYGRREGSSFWRELEIVELPLRKV